MEKNEIFSRVLKMLPDFRWDGEIDLPYKDEGDHFRGVRRVNLAGGKGENAAFHLRYFEISAGGYTSREHHQHEHVIFVVRGEGELLVDGAWKALKFGDIAYVAPGVTHQLRNDFREPFGFLCVVNAERDRPVVEEDPSSESPCGM